MYYNVNGRIRRVVSVLYDFFFDYIIHLNDNKVNKKIFIIFIVIFVFITNRNETVRLYEIIKINYIIIG